MSCENASRVKYKDPNHERWNDAGFVELDACFSALVRPNGDVLIHETSCRPRFSESNVFLPGVFTHRILGAYFRVTTPEGAPATQQSAPTK